MSAVHAFRSITTIEHHDGTPDTESVDLFCLSCALQKVKELQGQAPDDEITALLYEEMGDYEGDTLEEVIKEAVSYDQVYGEACSHLENQDHRSQGQLSAISQLLDAARRAADWLTTVYLAKEYEQDAAALSNALTSAINAWRTAASPAAPRE